MVSGIKDVAQRAGVAISTVSYVFSGRRVVAPKTREKVMRASEELGYIPNAGALMLRGQRTHIIALSSPMYESTNYESYSGFFMEVARRARFHGYDILLLASDDNKELERMADSGLVDGVILLDVAMDDERVEMAKTAKIPYLSIGRPRDLTHVLSIDLDFERMGRMAVDKLADAGHSDLLFVGETQADYVERGSNFLVRLRDGIIAQSDARGVTLNFLFLDDGIRTHDALSMAQRVASHNGTTGVIAQLGTVNLSNFVSSLRRLDMEVPEDLSLIAVASSGLADTLNPPIDEIPMLPHTVCEKGVDLLKEVVESEGGLVPLPSDELVEPRYVSRGSVMTRH